MYSFPSSNSNLSLSSGSGKSRSMNSATDNCIPDCGSIVVVTADVSLPSSHYKAMRPSMSLAAHVVARAFRHWMLPKPPRVPLMVRPARHARIFGPAQDGQKAGHTTWKGPEPGIPSTERTTIAPRQLQISRRLGGRPTSGSRMGRRDPDCQGIPPLPPRETGPLDHRLTSPAVLSLSQGAHGSTGSPCAGCVRRPNIGNELPGRGCCWTPAMSPWSGWSGIRRWCACGPAAPGPAWSRRPCWPGLRPTPG